MVVGTAVETSIVNTPTENVTAVSVNQNPALGGFRPPAPCLEACAHCSCSPAGKGDAFGSGVVDWVQLAGMMTGTSHNGTLMVGMSLIQGSRDWPVMLMAARSQVGGYVISWRELFVTGVITVWRRVLDINIISD